MNSDANGSAADTHTASGKAARDSSKKSQFEEFASTQSNERELISIDETIDAIGREALEEARRTEEAERYRSIPGPVMPPHKPVVAP